MHQYKKLEFWQRGRQLATDLYKNTKNFPKEELFGLTNQMRRSAISIISNISEGASRRSNKDFSRFLEIAMGSAFELETQLMIAKDLGYSDDKIYTGLDEQLGITIKQMRMFQKKLLIQSKVQHPISNIRNP